MSFLSKLGKVFSTVPKVVDAIQPSTMLIAGLLPTGPQGRVLDVFNGTAAIVAQTENAAQAAIAIANAKVDGPTKQAMAMPQVAALLNTSGFMFDKKVTDPAKFQEGVKALIDATVSIMNAVEQKSPDEINRDVQNQAVTNAKLNGQYEGGGQIVPIGVSTRKQ